MCSEKSTLAFDHLEVCALEPFFDPRDAFWWDIGLEFRLSDYTTSSPKNNSVYCQGFTA